MTETKSPAYPRRDADGRIATVGDLLGVSLAGLVAGAAVLLVFEAVFALLRMSTFGSASGWLAAILPIWLFVEEFRAVGFGAARIVAALLAAGFGVAIGLLAAGLVVGVPALFSGAAGAAAFTVVYALVWFYGLWWLRHRMG
jgi:hypothetical protein